MKTEKYTVENIQKIIDEIEKPCGELYEANKKCWRDTQIIQHDLTLASNKTKNEMFNRVLINDQSIVKMPRLRVNWSVKRNNYYVSVKSIEKFINKCNL